MRLPISPVISTARIALLDRALVLNPNLAAAWFLGGFLRTERGDPDAAIEYFTRAMRLSPLDPEMFRMQAGMALSHLFAERFDMASSWAEQSFRELPSFLVRGGSSSRQATRSPVEQSKHARQSHHMRKLDPTFRISSVEGWMPIRRPEHLARFVAGLRQAGLPE